MAEGRLEKYVVSGAMEEIMVLFISQGMGAFIWTDRAVMSCGRMGLLFCECLGIR